jgi:hypothetical protein
VPARVLAPAAPPLTRTGRFGGRGEEDPPAAVRSVRCGEKNEHLGFPQQPASIYM